MLSYPIAYAYRYQVNYSTEPIVRNIIKNKKLRLTFCQPTRNPAKRTGLKLLPRTNSYIQVRNSTARDFLQKWIEDSREVRESYHRTRIVGEHDGIHIYENELERFLLSMGVNIYWGLGGYKLLWSRPCMCARHMMCEWGNNACFNGSLRELFKLFSSLMRSSLKTRFWQGGDKPCNNWCLVGRTWLSWVCFDVLVVRLKIDSIVWKEFYVIQQDIRWFGVYASTRDVRRSRTSVRHFIIGSSYILDGSTIVHFVNVSMWEGVGWTWLHSSRFEYKSFIWIEILTTTVIGRCGITWTTMIKRLMIDIRSQSVTLHLLMIPLQKPTLHLLSLSQSRMPQPYGELVRVRCLTFRYSHTNRL